MPRLHENTLRQSIRDAITSTGWDDQRILLDLACEAVCLRHDIPDGDEKGRVRRRLNRVWADHFEITRPV